MSILILRSTLLIALGAFIVPKQWKGYVTLLPILLQVLISTNWAVMAWYSHDPLQVAFLDSYWNGDLVLVVDRISCFFIVIINLTCLTGIIYGMGYLEPYLNKKGSMTISLHYFSFAGLHLAMLLVVMLRDAFGFLVAWELMSLFSFVLVIFEGERELTLKTGINYLVQMHMCFVLLLIGFLYISSETGSFSLDALGPYFLNHNNLWIFLLFFLGFGIKAGFVPLHSWLPHAHPAAPSHVSGVMSGVMIKMGIYGIVRVLAQVQSQFLEIGFVVLAVSTVTALTGILYAIFQKDLKKTLAYSSIENIGIIGMGIGLSFVGNGINNELLVTLGLTGAFLHILNHSLYKSLLFYSAGNVYYETHTRDLNKLGGLARSMPFTTGVFIIGALAICALPPFNGFISEFLLYKSVFGNIAGSDFKWSLLDLGIFLSLVVVGGLSVFAFTKTVGIAFLGSKREKAPTTIKEVPLIMRFSSFIIISLMILVSILPGFFLSAIGKVAFVFTQLNISEQIIQFTSGTLWFIGIGNLTVIVIFAVIIAAKHYVQSRALIAHGPTWGCGYPAGDYKHQYTSTSYSDSMRELVGPLVMMDGKHTAFEEEEIFPKHRHFITNTKDWIEEKLVIKPVNYISTGLPKAGLAQTGKINHYLVYPLVFLITIALLTLIGAI